METERPLLIPFISLAAGLALSDSYGFLLPFSAVLSVLACLVFCSFIANRTLFNLCNACFFLVCGLCVLAPWKTPVLLPDSIFNHVSRTPVIVQGVITSRPVSTINQEGLSGSFVLRVEGVVGEKVLQPASGNLMIYVSNGEAEFTRGDKIRFSTRITVPHKLGLPGEFDYPRFLSFRKISATGRVDSSDDIVLMRSGAEDSLLRRADLISYRLGKFIRLSIPDENISSVVTALLIGDQKRIPTTLADAYTKSGVNHILSISGFHIGIIAVFIVQVSLLLVTRFEFLALRFNLRRVVLLMALPVMFLYLLLTGSAPATARSVIMLAAFVVALYVERESDPVNVLLLSALLLVVLDPPTLFDLSFQLSFLALWGITIIVMPVMGSFKKIENKSIRMLVQFTLTSLAAIAATMIPVLYYFNQVSINGIFTNFIIVPLLGYGAVLTGFCALPFVYLFPVVAHLLLWITAKIVLISNWLIMLFAQMPVFSFYGITGFDMLVFLAIMLVLTLVVNTRIKKSLCLLLPVLAISVHLAMPQVSDGKLHVTMLSVGQGESILLRMPDGTTMLVDGGGYLNDNGRDFGERLLVPALFKMRIRRIDKMVMTHSHPDHIGGLPYTARMIPVGEFMEPVSGGYGKQYEQLRSNLAEKQTPIRRLAAGDSFKLAEGVQMTVHSPSKTTTVSADVDLNEESLVFSISYGEVNVLFTADAGFASEQRILNEKRNIKSTILKVGHHGSRYSTLPEFLERVNPQVALISAGKGNSFGLPSQDTVSQLEKQSIRVYRTDNDGTIDLSSDGKSWEVVTNSNEVKNGKE